MTLLKRYQSYKIKKSRSWPYKYSGLLLNNGSGQDLWYDVPMTLESNVIKLHSKLFGQKNYEPTDRVMEIHNQIMTMVNSR